MKNTLIEKLNQLCGNKYDFLKLSYINIRRAEFLVEIGILYPEKHQQQVLEESTIISDLVQKIVDTKLKTKVRLIKSGFFADIFLVELESFLETYPSIATSIQPQNITIDENADIINIIIKLEPTVCNYVQDAGIMPKIREHFYFKYCEELNFEIQELENAQISIQNIQNHIKKTANEVTHLENEGGRFIKISERNEFVGGKVEGDAAYICDARINDTAVHCGVVEDLMILTKKPKPDQENSDKKFYKFKLRDFTGTINCIYFPTEKTREAIINLCDGKTIIAFGKTVLDTYNNDGSLQYIIRSVNLCSLPQDFRENRKMRKVADEYIAVYPIPYQKPTQSSLFETKQNVPSILKGKSFCVFDIETTGLDPRSCEIIEIGAVSIEDGEIKETFSSFVSIDTPVPQKITELTGIDDSHLVGQPIIKDVLADFLKFSHEKTLVAQNIAFDYSFISFHGEKHHIYFDNERIDTIILARRYLKNMKNYKLKSIVTRLNISNDDAHRALSDAMATAEAFIKLAALADQEKESL